MGTGVVLDGRGYILTNHHVIDGVKKIQVTLADGQKTVASVVAHDAATDLAIIKIPVDKPLEVIPIGISSDLMIGEPVIAVGNAYGYEHTVTRGIISALHRNVRVSDTQDYEDLIQTDASINPGNSGGPLLNIDGEMIGVNVAVRAGAHGIGFAIPVDKAMAVAANLLNVRRLENRWHGVTGWNEPGQRGRGLIVKAVAEGSPAAESGLVAGDVVQAVGEMSVARPLDFERALLGRAEGDKVPVLVERNSQPMKLELVVAPVAKPSPTIDELVWETLGMRLAPVQARQFRQTSTQYRGGLQVTSVRPDGPAAKQGIRRGDVLVGMHIFETVALSDLEYVLKMDNLAAISPVKYYILRNAEPYYGHLAIGKP
jgi:serine protease Do